MEDCFQGADLAKRWYSSLPHLLPNCCVDFSCDGWKSCSCIGQSCNLGDGYHPSSHWPTSSFVSLGDENQVYLAKVLVVQFFAMCIQTNPDTTMCFFVFFFTNNFILFYFLFIYFFLLSSFLKIHIA